MNDGITKLLFSDAFDATVDVSMKLEFDPDHLTKSAATIFECDYADIQPDDDHVGIHVVALGDFEHYGANRNADGFPKQACAKYHDTFVKHGHVFRHHRNKDPEKKLGDIVKSAYNAPMGRVELFIHVNKEKAPDELQKLANDGEIPFSMACVRAGTPVITAHGTVPVEAVKPTDLVLTHTGEWHTAGNRSVRESDHYMQISTVSWGRTVIEITDNHPFLAATFDDMPRLQKNATEHAERHFRRRHKAELCDYLKWVPAGELTAYHYLAVPIDRQVIDGGITEDWARVLGYYLAEGSLCQGGVQFTCHVNDDCVQELEQLAPWTSVTITPKSNSDKAVTVSAFGTTLRNSIEDTIGRAAGKRIPVEMMHATADCKYQFLAAWFNGDGWQDKNGLHWSTCRRHLAVDLQRMLATLNLPSSCMRIDHPEDRGIVQSIDAVEYVVSLSNQFSYLFSDISKADALTIHGATKCRTFISGDYLMVPVAGVTRVHETTEVFNFSVDADESYTVYGLAVHNCRVPFDRCNVCNTLRKSSKDPEQCSHVLTKLGDTLNDGKLVCVQNDTPDFFDISFVTRPADRIAWDLKLASGEIADSIKLAEAADLWVPDGVIIKSADALEKLGLVQKMATMESFYAGIANGGGFQSSVERYMWELRKSASHSMSDNDLDELRKYQPEDTFSALAQNGVILDPTTFFKYAMGDAYSELEPYIPGLLYKLRDSATCLVKAGHCQLVCNSHYFDVDMRRTLPPALKKLAHSLREQYGQHAVDANQRVIEHTIQPMQFDIDVDMQTKIGSNDEAIVEALEVKYASYKLSALKAIGSSSQNTDTDALIATAVAQNVVRSSQ